MRLLISGGEGYIGRGLAERAKQNGFSVQTLDKSGSPDICHDLCGGVFDGSDFDVAVHLASTRSTDCLLATRNLLLSLPRDIKRVFLLCPLQDGSVGRTIEKANTDVAVAMADQLGVQTTVIECGSVFGAGGGSCVVDQIARGENPAVDSGTAHFVPYSHLLDYLADVVPSVDWRPPGNKLACAGPPVSRHLLASLVSSITGKPWRPSGSARSEQAVSYETTEMFNLPSLSEETMLAEIMKYGR